MDYIVSKAIAIEKIEGFRERHIEEYKEQFIGWKDSMQAFSQTLKEWSEGPANVERPKEPKRPTNYLKQYDQLLERLSYHQLDTITIGEHEFDRIINDSFNWTGQWLENNTMYAGDNVPQRRKSPIYTMGSPDFKGALGRGEGQNYPSDHIEIS